MSYSAFKLRNKQPAVRYIPKHKKSEQAIQLALARHIRINHPGVHFHSDYAAGLHMTENQAKINKGMQSGRGWADMFIAKRMTHTIQGQDVTFSGLFIEIKVEGTSIWVTRGPRKGKLVQNEQIQLQAPFLLDMQKENFYAVFGVGLDKCTAIADWYLQTPQNGSLF